MAAAQALTHPQRRRYDFSLGGGASFWAAAEALVATKMYGEPHLEARGYYQGLDHPRSGRRRYPVWPMRFSYGPESHYATVAPTLGQHNAEILAGELGLGEEDLVRLEDASIIGCKMVGT